MRLSSMSSASIVSIITASLLAIACGGATEPGNDELAEEDPGVSEQALTWPIPTSPKACIVSSSIASFTFRCGAQGFRRTGAFDGGTNNVAFAYARDPSPWIDETSFPSAIMADPVDRDGALIFGGLGLNQRVPSGGMYRVDFVSPDLSSNFNWQGKTRYRFRILESYSLTPVFGQIVLEVVKPDGTIGLFREVNAANQSVFCSVPHGVWTDCVANIPLSPAHKLKSIQLRVFGEPFAAGEGAAFIDDVAPLD
jgi:hypothetical protein